MVVRERRLRFLSLLLLLMAVASLLAAGLAFPTGVVLNRYESSLIKLGALAEEVEKRKGDVAKDLEKTRVLIEYLGATKEKPRHSSLITDLDHAAGEEVVITHFNFDSKNKLILSGVATTRDSLSAFRDRLEGHEAFKSVELPLSSLVKDADVPFSMTITLR